MKQEFFNGERKQKIIVWLMLLPLLSPVKKKCMYIFTSLLLIFTCYKIDFFFLTAWYLTDFKNDFKVFKMFNRSI